MMSKPFLVALVAAAVLTVSGFLARVLPGGGDAAQAQSAGAGSLEYGMLIASFTPDESRKRDEAAIPEGDAGESLRKAQSSLVHYFKVTGNEGTDRLAMLNALNTLTASGWRLADGPHQPRSWMLVRNR